MVAGSGGCRRCSGTSANGCAKDSPRSLRTALPRQTMIKVRHRTLISGTAHPGGGHRMSTARDGRAELRRELLARIIALQLEVQTSGDAEARALLEEARAALREFDAECGGSIASTSCRS